MNHSFAPTFDDRPCSLILLRLQGQDDDAVEYSHQDGNDTSGAVRPPRLMKQVSDRIRRLALSRRTEQAYCGWIRHFILANGKRHPHEMGAPEIETFPTLDADPASAGAFGARASVAERDAATRQGLC